MTIGSHVSEKIKQDIWHDGYVDLTQLLPHSDSSAGKSRMMVDHLTQDLVVDKQNKKISTLDEWKQAFDTLIAIYTQIEVNQGQISHMLTYSQEVQGLARNGFDWFTYDQQYRMDRAANSSPPPWSTLNQVVYNYVVCKKISTPSFSGGQSKYDRPNHGSAHRIPKSYCFAYHTEGKRCSRHPCGYNHKCYKCKSAHPAFRCRRESGYQSREPYHDYPRSHENQNYGKRQPFRSDNFRNQPSKISKR